MLIGDDFSGKAKTLLRQIAAASNRDTGKKVDVKQLAETLKLDKTEMKNLLKYLENKEHIEIGSIGGPYLYGHITLTRRGLDKVKKLK